MSRIAIFAHFDKDNEIKNYVIYYLRELRKIADKIIFVSDCELNKNELSKINDIVVHSIAYKHGEYDFGSYMRGYIYAKQQYLLNNCDELIFANDSCYGPIYPLDKVWQNYAAKADFWGININSKMMPLHIQSFFIVFKPKVFLSGCFDQFITNIKKEKTKQDIIEKYELGLTQTLIRNGFRPAAIFQDSIEMRYKSGLLFAKKINPFIKKSCFYGLSVIFVYFTSCFIFFKHKINYPKSNILECINIKYPCINDFIKSLQFIKINMSKNNKYNSKIEDVIPLNVFQNHNI